MAADRMIARLYYDCLHASDGAKSRVGICVRGKTFFGILGKLDAASNYVELIGAIPGRASPILIMLDKIDYAYLAPAAK